MILTVNISRHPWEYGMFRTDQIARRHKRKGTVQFLALSRKVWMDSDRSWWSTFRPFKAEDYLDET